MNITQLPIGDEQDQDKEYKETFDKIQVPLKEVLDEFEWQEYISTGMKHLNGGYTTADLEDIVDDWVYIRLKWGISGEVDHIEHYKISVDTILEDKPVRDKVNDMYEE